MSPEISVYNTNNGKCTTGWYITGYFTPVEREYNGTYKKVPVFTQNLEQAEQRTFLKDFLNDTQIEGWGKTIKGDYIYFNPYTRQWYSDLVPRDAAGNKLVREKTVAVDPAIIKTGLNLTIPTLAEPWNMSVYQALDIGPSVQGKHVDVYTGEGKNAKKDTFKITGHNNTVCVVNQ